MMSNRQPMRIRREQRGFALPAIPAETEELVETQSDAGRSQYLVLTVTEDETTLLFQNTGTACAMMILPREVLLEISKWLSLEERMTRLALVGKYLYNVMHDLSLWRTVYSNAESTISLFNCPFRRDKDLRYLH